jgi:iron-sulfur cluster repair protein YtfE (RIC family)
MSTTQGCTARFRQMRLPGQTAAPDGPADLRMMFLMHHAFRRDLDAFATAAPVTPVDDVAAWTAMNRRWALLSQALHHHHTGEDTLLWPLLHARADATGRATLDAMEAEHGEIDPLLEAAAQGLAAMAAGGDEDVRGALAVRLSALRQSLGRHLRHEETEALPLLQATMTAQEWVDVQAELAKGVSFGQVLRLVPWLAHRVPADVRAGLFAEKGGRVHQAVWLLTRRRFERQDRTAFRHSA